MLSQIKSILLHRGFVLYTRPYELNIIGVRANSVQANRFDDHIHVFYKTGPVNWEYHIFNATTDPGTYWLENPSNPQGTAILSQGQYIGCYQIGLHKGQYTALVQRKPVTVLRDYDRNAILDFFNGAPQTGNFGINIHRASVSGITKYVDRYSAGCQVFENASDFALFLTLCEKHRSLYGNVFTYTLIDDRTTVRSNLRKLTISSLTLGALVTSGYLYYTS